jgi:hypothetical protein
MAHLSNCVFDKCNGLGGCQIVDQSASSFTSFFDSIKTAVNAKPPRGKKVEDNHQMLDDYLGREYPEISSGQQQEAIFMPDCFISRHPKVVDTDPKTLEQLGDSAAAKKMKDRKEIFAGDTTEKILFEMLQKFFSKSRKVTEKKTVVIHSFKDRYLDDLEFDFLIVNQESKMIICIECKKSATEKNCQDDAAKLQKRLEYFRKNMPCQNDWTFIKGFFGEDFSRNPEVLRNDRSR